MNSLQHLFSSEFIEAIGWTIVHSLWQGTLVALVLTVLLVLMRKNSAQLKYLISFFALLIIIGWSGITFVNAYSYAKEKTALKENITSDPNYIKNYLSEQLGQETVDQEAAEKAKLDININLIKIRSFFQRNFNAICLLWMLGMLFLIFKMIGGFIYAKRLRTYQLVEIDHRWVEKIEEFAAKLNIQRRVNAFFSPLAKVPMTLGTVKPIILFPVAAFTGLSVKDVEAILAHELAHIVRHDYLFNIIQSIVEILFFYHPAVWMISSHIRSERENSCDNLAIQLIGDKIAYVKALAAVQINQMEQGQLAMAFASPKGNLVQRIKRLQKQVAMKTNFIEGLIAAIVVVVGLTLVSFTIGDRVSPQMMPDENLASELPMKDTVNSKKTVWTVQKRDSIEKELQYNIQHSEELDKVSEDMKKMVEVAMSEQDNELSAEMMEDINNALKDLDIEGIVQEALKETQQALKEVNMQEVMEDAKKDIDFDEIRRDMEEARRDVEEARREIREDMRRDMENDDVPQEIIDLSVSAAEAGLNAASAVLENLPVDEIIDAALSGVSAAFDALGEIDFDQIKSDSLSEEDITRLKEQLEKQEQKLQEQKEKLKAKEKELKSKEKK